MKAEQLNSEGQGKISQVVDDISKIGLILIVLGYLNMYFYYDYFGLPIYQYLETSEIIFSFSSIIQTGYYFLVMMVLVRISSYLKRDETERMFLQIKRERELKEKVKGETEVVQIPDGNVTGPKRFSRKWILDKLVFFLFAIAGQLIFLALFVYVGTFFSGLRIDTRERQMILEMCFIIILMIVYSLTPRGTSKNALYLAYLALIILFLYIRTNASHNSVMDGEPKYSAKMILNDGTFRNSNDSVMYVGGVRQYHFFHNIKSRENIIVPVSWIKEIQVKELRGGI